MTSTEGKPELLRVEDLTVYYGPRVGLDAVSFGVRWGEIHALFGPPDSGKSTLINALSGRIPRYRGAITYEGRLIKRLTPRRALSLGISAIHQNLYLYPRWSAFENIYLNQRVRKSFFTLDREGMRQRALAVFRDLSADIDLDVPVMYYTVSQRQMIQIAKSVCVLPKLLLVDELSVKLTAGELERFHYLLSLLREKGVSILYATGNMEEIFNFASRVTILKNSRVVETTSISGLDKLQLVKLTYSFMARRKELEETNFELFYLKNFYESIFNHIPLPLMVTDTRGTIVFLNTCIIDLLGIDAGSYVDRFFNDLLALPETSVCTIQETILRGAGPRSPGVRLEIPRSSRELVMMPLHDEDGSFIGTLTTITDGHGPDKSEESGKGMGGRPPAEKLTGWIAHEINNPLSVILNYLNVIKSESSIAHIKTHTEQVAREVRRIKHIMEKSLHAARLSGKAFPKVRVDMLLDEVLQLMKPTIEQSGIALALDLRRGILASVDPDLFKQVIVNLLLNAVEATQGGGQVRISSDLQKEDRQVYMVITIRDSGIGIPEDDHSRIFEPFYTTKDHGETGGLGLSICRDILNQYDGTLTVSSMPGKGSTFRILLPYR